MSSQVNMGIQPSILRWARLRSGYAVSDVAKKLKKSVEEVEAWENGEDFPSYAILEKLAYSLYNRPLATFFLPEPPEEESPSHEFRTLPELDLATLDPSTYKIIRKAHAYQLSLEEVFSGRNPEKRPIWHKFELHPDESVEHQAEKIRITLNGDVNTRFLWGEDDEALRYWIAEIEKQGIFVFRDTFKQKEISGLCLTHEEFPMIYLNNTTTKTRQIFSLFHELAHILLGMNGISKFEDDYIDQLNDKEKQLEIFCNKFAAELLIPYKDFKEQTKNLSFDIEDDVEQIVQPLASRYCVSREAILRIFLDEGRVSEQTYRIKAEYWNSQIKNKGGNWFSNKNAYLSTRFAKEVIGMHYQHRINIEQASELLGVHAKNFAGLEHRILKSAQV